MSWESPASSSNLLPSTLLDESALSFDEGDEDDGDSYASGYETDEFFGLDVPDRPLIHNNEDLAINQGRDNGNDEQTKLKAEDWTNRLISDVGEPCTLLVDQSIKEAWDSGIEEAAHIRSSLRNLLDVSANEKISIQNIFDALLGSNSDFYAVFHRELAMDRITFCKFIGTLCLQMSYRETPGSMFDDFSLINDKVLMGKEDYMNAWKEMANLKRVDGNNFVGAARRPECLWEMLETVVNKLLRRIVIEGRGDDVTIALDDDKVWVDTSGRNDNDHFGIQKTTHVQDNKKGFNSHTAAQMPSIIPMGFIFERTGENSVQCFKKLYQTMFAATAESVPDLSGIENLSDRGYTKEPTIDFIVLAGAKFLHTAMRIPIFPFIWGKKPGKNDKRQFLSEKGCPTLFIKEIIHKGDLISLLAFRTDTSNISAIVTNELNFHEWEGVCLSNKQRLLWEEDNTHGLDDLHFPCLARFDSLAGLFQEKMNDMLKILREEEVDVLTLEQGTADWHKGRQFSITSSQSDGSFTKALIIYQHDPNFVKVATYLHGKNYNECK